MAKEKSGAIKRRLLTAIVKAERDRDKLSDLSRGYSKRLAAIVAKELGIEVGKRYRVMPRPGNAYTVTVWEIGSVMPYSARIGEAKAGDLYINVLVYCERKNGHDVYRSEWISTNRYEFYPVKDEEKSAAPPKGLRKSQRNGTRHGESHDAVTGGARAPLN